MISAGSRDLQRVEKLCQPRGKPGECRRLLRQRCRATEPGKSRRDDMHACCHQARQRPLVHPMVESPAMEKENRYPVPGLPVGDGAPTNDDRLPGQPEGLGISLIALGKATQAWCRD